jgi:hypothetical protein
MKNFDSRTYSISDFVEWERAKPKQLVLNPKFQRRSVWSDTARSYLMDTIVRGKPIPKVFIRQQIDTRKQTSYREVVDGQQRLRTILSYVKDEFAILSRHNAEFGGKKFSALDETAQASILSYEIATDLLVNLPDAEILDVFSRLNSYAVVLNPQEKIHAKHFGPFKILIDNIAHGQNAFWSGQKVLTDQQILRMGDVTLTADLVIAMLEGIRSKKQIATYYAKYEENFPQNTDDIRRKFAAVISAIQELFPAGLKTTEFRRIHLFYSLFTALYHKRYGLPDFDKSKYPIVGPIKEAHFRRWETELGYVEGILAAEDVRELNKGAVQFLQDTRRATTDAPVRVRRTEFLLDLMRS